MGGLTAIINNAIIGEMRIRDKGKTRIAVWISDKNIKDINGTFSFCYGLERRFPIAEIDLLHIKEKESGIRVYSFELKSSQRRTRRLDRQLLGHSISLLLTALEGFYMCSNNICMSLDDKLIKKPLEIRVMYVNGYKEDELKEKSPNLLLQILYRNGREFSNIHIFRRGDEFFIKYKFLLYQYIISGELAIQVYNVNFYRGIITESYRDVLSDIYNGRGDLRSILIRYEKINNLNLEAFSRIQQ